MDVDELRQELKEKLKELDEFLKDITIPDNALTSEGQTNGNQISNQQDSFGFDPNGLTKLNKALSMLNTVVESLSSILNSCDGLTKETPSLPLPYNKINFEKLQKMISEKTDQEKQMINDESAIAVCNMIDMAISYSEASNVNNGIVAEKLKQQCNLLFEKGLPVVSFVDGLEDLLDEEFVLNVRPEELQLEVERQYNINETQVCEYLSSRVSGETLGHVVHRLLGTKYPRPPPPPGSDLPWLPVMSLLLGFDDSEAMGNLHEMLTGQGIQLVLFEYALESCIGAYRKEGPGLPLLESRDPPPCKEKPETVTPMDRLLPHAMLGNRKLGNTEVPSHMEKETQTGPEIIPILSLAASLGKQALEILRLNEYLSDWLMVAILVEYLKEISTSGISGWVLADFPTTFTQISLFESAITGQHVPNPDLKPEQENHSTLTLHQSRIVCDPSEPIKSLQPFKTIFTSVVSVVDTSIPSEPQLLDFVSLVQELYIRQGVHYCLHCKTWNEENIVALAALLLETPSLLTSDETKEVLNNQEFVDFPIPNELALGLASLWESLETTYLSSLHRVFLTYRSHEQRVDKYIVTMRFEFCNFLSRPDIMQEMVTSFQQNYHELPDDKKVDDTEVQTELRTRVENLRQSLCDTTELRKKESELELHRVAGQPWLSRELGELLNITSAKVQLELDRFVDTTALLQDYFFASLDKIPPDASKSLRFDVPKAVSSEITDDWAATLVDKLISPEEESDTELPETFLKHLDSVLQGAKSHLEKMNSTIGTSITRLENEIKPKPAPSKKKQVIDKTKNKKKSTGAASIVPLEDEEVLKLISLKLQLLSDWRSTCKSEAELVVMKLEEICQLVNTQAQNLIRKIATEFFEVATIAYNTQCKYDNHSIASLCEFLEFVVTAGSSLTSPLVLVRNTSYRQYLNNPHGDNNALPPTIDFTMAAKLTSLIDTLQRVAPEGILLKQAFVMILQQASISQQCSYLPSSWQDLSLENINSIVDTVSCTDSVDWRAFILRILELPVPTQTQLLLAKYRFEQHDKTGRGKINKNNFLKTRLWLEEAFEHNEDAEQTKEVIFNIFSNPSRDLTNYRDFLLSSSHDTNPALGCAKACAVYTGHIIKTNIEVENENDKAINVMLKEIKITFPQTTMINLDTVNAVLSIGIPSKEPADLNLQEILQEVFKEVEEQSLTDEQRRARHRQAVLTPQNVPDDPVTTVLANFLLPHPTIVKLSMPAYHTESISAFIQKLKTQPVDHEI